jgi:hypothetical protein
MKQILLGALATVVLGAPAFSQSITITASDMPVGGDKLLHSNATVPTNFDINDSGANKTWDFSSLAPLSQTIDTYKTAIQAGYIGGGIAVSAYGYKVFDSIPFPGAPVTPKNGYTFFNIKTGPSRFVAEGFGASISGFPIAAGYSAEDTIYALPLTYGDTKTSTYKLTASLPGTGSLSQQGTRTTKVDGWGTLKTPYFTTPVAVIRVRSEVNEIDTVKFLTTTIPVPRHTVEYKWLAKGEHYPALIITTTVTGGTETPTVAQYRDIQRSLGVSTAAPAYTALQAYPNPATTEVTVKVPVSWKHYTMRMYDMSGKLLAEVVDNQRMSTEVLAEGHYIIVADNGTEIGLTQFVK